jgi:tetratricopeptide (TPR) repeat protein
VRSLLAILVVLAAVATASAQPVPDDQAKEVARAHFEKAKALHDKKQYLEAAVEYLEAYRHLPVPAFLYNAGQVYRLAGEKKKALHHYERYLELEPKGEGSDDARQFVSELRAALAAEEAAVPAPEVTPEPVPQPPQPRDRTERPGRTLKVAGLVSGGIGLAAIGAAVVFAARASSAQGDLDGFRGEWTPAQQERYDSGAAADRNMTISLAVGAAAIAAGGALYFFGHRQAGRVETTVAAVADGSGGMVLLRGGF